MSAQHVRPGRSGKRVRRERALERLESELAEVRRAHRLEEYSSSYDEDYFYKRFVLPLQGRIEQLKAELARPLHPIPPHQTRKLTR